MVLFQQLSRSTGSLANQERLFYENSFDYFHFEKRSLIFKTFSPVFRRCTAILKTLPAHVHANFQQLLPILYQFNEASISLISNSIRCDSFRLVSLLKIDTFRSIWNAMTALDSRKEGRRCRTVRFYRVSQPTVSLLRAAPLPNPVSRNRFHANVSYFATDECGSSNRKRFQFKSVELSVLQRAFPRDQLIASLSYLGQVLINFFLFLSTSRKMSCVIGTVETLWSQVCWRSCCFLWIFHQALRWLMSSTAFESIMWFRISECQLPLSTDFSFGGH